FTFTSRSLEAHTIAASAIVAAAARYASSPQPMPSPARVSTSTRCPASTSACAPSGVSPTRYSSFLISRTVPIVVTLYSSRLRIGGGTDDREAQRREVGGWMLDVRDARPTSNI